MMKRIFLLFWAVLFLAGCATTVRYVNYTDQKFPPKQKYYYITVYESQSPSSIQPFQILGRVEVSGLASNGVTPDTLIDQARHVARVKGADAIINARTEATIYNKIDEAPGYFGRHHYHPGGYIVYGERLLTFRGELIVFVPK